MSSKYYKVKYSDHRSDYCGVVEAPNPLKAYMDFADGLDGDWFIKDIEFMEFSDKQNNIAEVKNSA